MTILKQVLQTFETARAPLSLGQMAQQLNVEPSMLEEMITYWVRKGKLREVSGSGCTTCGLKHDCTPMIKLPRRYELATGSDESLPPPPGGCSCCG